MKIALVFITLFHSLMLMSRHHVEAQQTQSVEDDVNELNLHRPAEYFCGRRLREAMKNFCKPEILGRLKRSAMTPFDYGRGRNYESVIEPVSGYYEDDFSSNEGNYRYDMVPNYLYNWPVKRSDPKLTITQACCKNPCTIRLLTEFCPPITASRRT